MQRRLIKAERPIYLRHHLPRARIFRADHDPVGTLEILDRRALAQELRVGDDGEIRVRPDLADDALEPRRLCRPARSIC